MKQTLKGQISVPAPMRSYCERVRGVYVDTGLMRAGETEFVRETLATLGVVKIEDCQQEFLSALELVRDPEVKRHIIGEQFVAVQQRIIDDWGLLSGKWILGQGTIYPDTIESGGSARAALIKTHHNRVPGIQKLMDAGLIIEPLADFYKDEVREAGRELGLPPEFLYRHPFPGPGLAIRCLCSESDYEIRHDRDGWVLPVHSVGVQGDSRSYRAALAIGALDHDRATRLTNERSDVNRIVGIVGSHLPVDSMRVGKSHLSAARLDRLRAADSIVRRLSRESGFENEVWQFPVVLIPVGDAERPDSVVLRPIHSVDGMTAQSVRMPAELLNAMKAELLALGGVCAVFYDLTHKPPGTIEWE